MKLKRFLTTVMRIRPPDPDATNIRFIVDDKEELVVKFIKFSTESDWEVHLRRGKE
jgi:hypothetical protein